jgi:hypothetical protein
MLIPLNARMPFVHAPTHSLPLLPLSPLCLTPPRSYVWGSNDAGQLGIRSAGAELAEPRRVEALDNFKVLGVACGPSHTLAIVDHNASLAAWGRAEYGALGLGEGGGGSEGPTRIDVPRVLRGAGAPHALRRVAAGGNHSLILNAVGEVSSCGDGTFGALGVGGFDSKSSVPRPIVRLWPLGITQVWCVCGEGRLEKGGKGGGGGVPGGEMGGGAACHA